MINYHLFAKSHRHRLALSRGSRGTVYVVTASCTVPMLVCRREAVSSCRESSHCLEKNRERFYLTMLALIQAQHRLAKTFIRQNEHSLMGRQRLGPTACMILGFPRGSRGSILIPPPCNAEGRSRASGGSGEELKGPSAVDGVVGSSRRKLSGSEQVCWGVRNLVFSRLRIGQGVSHPPALCLWHNVNTNCLLPPDLTASVVLACTFRDGFAFPLPHPIPWPRPGSCPALYRLVSYAQTLSFSFLDLLIAVITTTTTTIQNTTCRPQLSVCGLSAHTPSMVPMFVASPDLLGEMHNADAKLFPSMLSSLPVPSPPRAGAPRSTRSTRLPPKPSRT